MRMKLAAVLGCLSLLINLGVAKCEEDTRALIVKAVQAMGGEAELAKYKAMTANMKGDIQLMGNKVPFTAQLWTQGADQQKISIELEVGGQKLTVVEVLNRDKGWLKLNADTTDMDKDKLAETQETAWAGWVASLAPLLKGKGFTLSSLGEIQVDGSPALGVRVSHAGHRDVSLYFDKATNFLVKSESRVKDEETGQEVTEEAFYKAYEGKDIKHALKLSLKRDGKPFLDADMTEVEYLEKLEDSVFAKP